MMSSAVSSYKLIFVWSMHSALGTYLHVSLQSVLCFVHSPADPACRQDLSPYNCARHQYSSRHHRDRNECHVRT